MKIRKAENISPIYLSPGDSIELQYEETNLDTRKMTKRTLAKEVVERSMTVDRIAIVDLDDEELKPLGMDDAIAGVFGEGTKEPGE